MCGIVGYVGHRQAAPVILDGLKRLEYRGYDSAGVVVAPPGRNGSAGLQVVTPRTSEFRRMPAGDGL